MLRARAPIDLHEIQRRELEAEMQTERPRAAPPRGTPPMARPPPQQPSALPLAMPSSVRPLAPPARFGSGTVTRNEIGRGIDVHELLKQEAFAGNSASCDNHFEKNRPCPSDVYGISDQHVVLDTFYKIEESRPDRGYFKWNFMVQGVTGNQVIGVRDKMDNVVEIQMSAFTMPIPAEVPYVLRSAPGAPTGTNQLVLIQNNNNGAAPFNPRLLAAQYPASIPSQAVWVDNPYSQLPCGNRMTVQFVEAGLQSFSDANGARHHFEFFVGYAAAAGGNPNMLTAAPLDGRRWDSFIFTEPLQDVLGMTLVFRGVDSPVAFPEDCLYAVSVAADAAAAPGPYLAFTAPNHGLAVGDRVFVRGFDSGVSALDIYVNRPEGHVASGDPALAPLAPSTPIPTPNTFWLDPAVSIIDMTAPAPALPQLVTVCIAKRRMRLQLRLRRIVPRLTNYMAPVS